MVNKKMDNIKSYFDDTEIKDTNLPKHFRTKVKDDSKKFAMNFFLTRKKDIEKSVEELYQDH